MALQLLTAGPPSAAHHLVLPHSPDSCQSHAAGQGGSPHRHTDQEMSEKYCDVELNLIHSLSKFFSLSNAIRNCFAVVVVASGGPHV